jgi:hypothetical protein
VREVQPLDHVRRVASGGLVEQVAVVQSPQVALRAYAIDLADEGPPRLLGSRLELDVSVAAGRRLAGVGVLRGQRGQRRDGGDHADADATPARAGEPPAGVVVIRAGRGATDAEEDEDGQDPDRQGPCQEKHHEPC